METHDSLPYIDEDITQGQRDAATSLIRKQLPRDYATTFHPSLADPPASRLTPALHQEVVRVSAGKPIAGGVDLSRYEASDEDSFDDDVEVARSALRTAYANISYLRDRQANIALLEEYGKNSWLIGNSHLEDVQKRLDAELAATKARSEEINKTRKALQEDARGELIGLADTWKKGIDKIIQTQLASDALKREDTRKSQTIPP